jgi:hypothetical protein
LTTWSNQLIPEIQTQGVCPAGKPRRVFCCAQGG